MVNLALTACMIGHAHALGSSRRMQKGGFVVGADIGASNLRVALATRDGSLVGKWHGSTKKTPSPYGVI